MPPRDSRLELPHINPWLMDGFQRHFLPRYLRKHFHVVAADRRTLTPETIDGRTSLVVYCNHASWWDPMLAIYMRSVLMPAHNLYAPIDSTALEQYKIFKSMGFYGVDGSHRGAAEFLKRSLQILHTPGSSLWLTPEGKFCDPRQLGEPLQPGLAHLAHSIQREPKGANPSSLNVSHVRPNIWFVPAAIEYVFWEERSPECLCRFGEPIQVEWHAEQVRSKDEWQALLNASLRGTQRMLAAASIARDTSQFEVLLRGSVGSWSIYDMARRSWARVRGKKVSMQHSGIWKCDM